VNDRRLLRVHSLQPPRDFGADVGHQTMPALGRFILARGQRTRLTRTLEELAQVRAFQERRDREDQPVARVCLHHLGNMRIGERGAAPGGLQERLADRARGF
jgi:hypothetical protein